MYNFLAIRHYLFLILVSFVGLKFSIWPVIFIYPFCIYQILKRSTLWSGTFWLFLLGFLYAGCLFFWATTTGIELSFLVGTISSVVFGGSALCFKLVEKHLYPKINWLHQLDWAIWPAFFYVWQQYTFPLFGIDASFLIDIPSFLPYTYYYIGSGGMHALLLASSIAMGIAWSQKKTVARVITTTLVVGLCAAQIHHLYLPAPVSEDTVKVALIQGNQHEEIDWKRNHAQDLYEKYVKKIEIAAKQGAKIIVLPENAILFWGSNLNIPQTKGALIGLARAHGIYIIFSTLETNPDGQIQSLGYVFSPDNGLERAYPAQRVYDYIAQGEKFEVGDELIIYPTPYGNLRLMICFEALFRDQLDQERDANYDHIVIMANNQFLPSHRGLKTLEWNVQNIAGTYRKNVLYASNNGPTSVTNQYGRSTHRLAYDTEAILYATIALPDPR